MAETPFTPESGAASGGTVPEDGTQGIPAQSPVEGSPEAVSAPTPPSEPPAALEAVLAEPAVVAEPAVAPAAPGQASVALAAPEQVSDAPAAVEAAAGEPEAVSTAAASVDAAGVDATPSEPSTQAAPAPAAAEPAVQPPGVAATIAVPPLEAAEGGGGEWELLVERFSTWWNSGELTRQWQRIRGPLKGVAILVAVLVALQVYATAVSTIDGIPLVSGLLELTGLIAVLQFSARRLLRSSDRQEVLAQVQRRWLDFRGRG